MNESENIPTSPPGFKGSDYLADIIKSISAGNIDTSPTLDSQRPPLPQNDLFSSLLSSPELIAKLPSIISTVKPIIEMLGKSASMSGAAAASEPQKSIPAAIASQKTHANDSRTALLCALKPYLGAERQNAIDYVVKLGRLSEVLKTL